MGFPPNTSNIASYGKSPPFEAWAVVFDRFCDFVHPLTFYFPIYFCVSIYIDSKTYSNRTENVKNTKNIFTNYRLGVEGTPRHPPAIFDDWWWLQQPYKPPKPHLVSMLPPCLPPTSKRHQNQKLKLKVMICATHSLFLTTQRCTDTKNQKK